MDRRDNMPNQQSHGTDEIKVAVLGFGLAGRVFHAPFVSAVPGLRLTAIVQRRGDEAAHAYPGVAILRSVEEALASDVDLIVVGTPNETHYPLAKQSLEAGKHVVVDKPFAATSEQARELMHLAARRNLVLAPFQNRRWDGDFLTVRDLLEQKALGRLVTFESHFDRYRPLPRPNTWKESASACNGLLFDLAPHLLDQALALFGAPQGITANVRHDRDASDIEDAFDIILHYPRLLAFCRSTMLACDPSPRFLLHGTKGSFKKYGLDPQEPALVAGAHVPRLSENPSSKPDQWLLDKESHWGLLTVAPDPAEPGIVVTRKIETRPGDYRGFYANVRDAIRGTAPLAVTPEDGYRTIKLLELARESSATGRTLPVKF
jgi:scyllo-inositol 2-dehydrogenase (NADP+)